MKIVAITKTNCPKCAWAKRALVNFPVEWRNFDEDERAEEYVKEHNIEYVPFFIIYDSEGFVITTTKNVLQVVRFVRKL